jgi:hypothetical protein
VPTTSDTALHTSTNNTRANTATEIFQNATVDRAVDTMEDLAMDGSVWDRACDALKEETIRLAEAGLHVTFDSVRDSQPPRVAEIE